VLRVEGKRPGFYDAVVLSIQCSAWLASMSSLGSPWRSRVH
jgi:hypothetical protein